MIHVIRDKKTGEEIQRFEGLTERGFRGLMMKMDSKRFNVGIHADKKGADAGTVDAKAKAIMAKAEAKTRRSIAKEGAVITDSPPCTHFTPKQLAGRKAARG